MATVAKTRKSNADDTNVRRNKVFVIQPMTANEMRKALGINKKNRQTANYIAKKLQSSANVNAK